MINPTKNYMEVTNMIEIICLNRTSRKETKSRILPLLYIKSEISENENMNVSDSQ